MSELEKKYSRESWELVEKTSKVTRKYSDLDFDFIAHPLSGDVPALTDSDAVKRSIRNLMLTGTYERPFQPTIGANLKQLLFEPINPMTQMSIQLLITDVIRLHEPRVAVLDLKVQVSEDESGYNVVLVFAINETSEITTVDFFLERLR